MSFSHPLALVVAILAALVFLAAVRAGARRRAQGALAYSNLAFVREAIGASRLPRALLTAAWTLAILLLGASFAGAHVMARVPQTGNTAIVAVDTSGSMAAQDVEPSRADAVRAAARGFVDAVPPGTRVGLVSFAGGANVIAQPTDDRDAVREAIDRIPPPNGATAIGDALAVSGGLLPATGKRAVVLVTDGVNNRGVDPLSEAKLLAQKNVVIYTIGIGSADSGQFIPGTNVLADLDEATLKQIAAESGGKYLRARDASQVRDALSGIALTTGWERKRIDASLPLAIAGGFLMALAALSAAFLGRFP